MAKSKKKVSEDKLERTISEVTRRINGSNGSQIFFVDQGSFPECEWCFQFDDEEPEVFATGSSQFGQEPKLIFTLTNKVNSNLMFNKNGKRFNIFTRKKAN